MPFKWIHLLFKNTWYFTILYACVFLIDAYVKVNLEAFPFRFVSKMSLITLLLVYYLINQKEENIRKVQLMVLALVCFIIGDMFIIVGDHKLMLVVGVALFAIAKILYSIRFSNKQDFNIIRLLPFLMFCFSYMCTVMLFIFDNLGHYFLPVLGYLFIVLIVAQFAYLRKNEVNALSYWLVLIGIIASMFSDSINLLKEFYDPDFAHNKISIMFFYGLSQYLIVVGIVKEAEPKLSLLSEQND